MLIVGSLGGHSLSVLLLFVSYDFPTRKGGFILEEVFTI